jgi:hypothetical protein
MGETGVEVGGELLFGPDQSTPYHQHLIRSIINAPRKLGRYLITTYLWATWGQACQGWLVSVGNSVRSMVCADWFSEIIIKP